MRYTTVDVPLQYTVEYTEPPKRTLIAGCFARNVQIEVPTVFSGEATLVATVNDRSFKHNGSQTIKEYWSYDGDFFSPLDSNEESFNPGYFFEYDPVVLSTWKNRVVREVPEHGKISRIGGRNASSLDEVNDVLDRMHHDMQTEIEKVGLFVDGRLMRKTQLPKLHGEMIYRFNGAHVKLALWRANQELVENQFLEIATNLRGYEALREWAYAFTRIENEKEGRETDLSQWHEINIIEPSLLPDDQTFEKHVLYLSNGLLQADNLLRERSDAMIEAWLEARRCHTAATSTMDVPSIERLLDAWDRWMEIYHHEETLRCKSFEGRHDADDDVMQIALTAARVFWESRPMNELGPRLGPELRFPKQ
jgi:hypothetical protein